MLAYVLHRQFRGRQFMLARRHVSCTGFLCGNLIVSPVPNCVPKHLYISYPIIHKV